MSASVVSQDTKLIHETFVPPIRQLAISRQRNAKRNWGFTKKDFAALGEPSAQPKAKLSVVVLDISLDTVEHTFEEAWHFAASVQPNHWRWEELKSDRNHLRLLPGITHKRGLRWVVVDLAANWDRSVGISPADVRNAKTSPHSAILWAASYFPEWVQAMDGTTVPYVWIPGYQVTDAAGDDQWSCVPHLDWCRSFRRVELSMRGVHYRREDWAVPSFRE